MYEGPAVLTAAITGDRKPAAHSNPQAYLPGGSLFESHRDQGSEIRDQRSEIRKDRRPEPTAVLAFCLF
jgi:hypothetical protein